jgi:hypothetical protein
MDGAWRASRGTLPPREPSPVCATVRADANRARRRDDAASRRARANGPVQQTDPVSRPLRGDDLRHRLRALGGRAQWGWLRDRPTRWPRHNRPARELRGRNGAQAQGSARRGDHLDLRTPRLLEPEPPTPGPAPRRDRPRDDDPRGPTGPPHDLSPGASLRRGRQATQADLLDLSERGQPGLTSSEEGAGTRGGGNWGTSPTGPPAHAGARDRRNGAATRADDGGGPRPWATDEWRRRSRRHVRRHCASDQPVRRAISTTTDL